MLALYFLLDGMIGRFRYLRPALAAMLVFVGVKMAAGDLCIAGRGLSWRHRAIVGIAALASIRPTLRDLTRR